MNPYAYDGYFPYPSSQFPVIEYMIRLMNRRVNIELEANITYTFSNVTNGKIKNKLKSKKMRHLRMYRRKF
jgi:hypothetical protein